MRVCARCQRHVMHKTCPFCAARRLAVAGAITAVSCGGLVNVPEDASVDSSTVDAADAADGGFFFRDTGYDTADVPEDRRIVPVYGAPPLPDL